METIKQLITDGKTDEAIRLLDEYIEKNTSSDEAYYLRGNAFSLTGLPIPVPFLPARCPKPGAPPLSRLRQAGDHDLNT